MPNRFAPGCCCDDDDCKDDTVIFTAKKPTAELPAVTNLAQAVLYTQTEHNWLSTVTAIARVGRAGDTRHRRQSFITVDPALYATITKVEVNFRFRGLVPGPATFRIVDPIPMAAPPANGLALDATIAESLTTTIPPQTFIGVQSLDFVTLDFTEQYKRAIDGSVSNFLLAVIESTIDSEHGIQFDNFVIVFTFAENPQTLRSGGPSLPFSKKDDTQSVANTLEPRGGRVVSTASTITYRTAMRFEAGKSRDLAAISSAIIASNGNGTGAGTNGCLLAGPVLDQMPPITNAEAAVLIAACPHSLPFTPNTTSLSITGMLAELPAGTLAVMLFLSPVANPVTSQAMTGSNARLQIIAGVLPFTEVAPGVFFDMETNEWVIDRFKIADWWTVTITQQTFTENVGDYGLLYRICTGDPRGSFVDALSLDHERTIADANTDGSVAFGEKVESVLTVSPAIPIAGAYGVGFSRITSRPQTTLLSQTKTGRFLFGGLWEYSPAIPGDAGSGVSARWSYSAPTVQTQGIILQPLPRELKHLRIKLEEKTLEGAPHETTGSWRVDFSRIPDEEREKRLFCLNPKICNATAPHYMTPMWWPNTINPEPPGANLSHTIFFDICESWTSGNGYLVRIWIAAETQTDFVVACVLNMGTGVSFNGNYEWRRNVAKWRGAPPTLTFRGDGPDVIASTVGNASPGDVSVTFSAAQTAMPQPPEPPEPELPADV